MQIYIVYKINENTLDVFEHPNNDTPLWTTIKRRTGQSPLNVQVVAAENHCEALQIGSAYLSPPRPQSSESSSPPVLRCTPGGQGG